MTGAVEVSPQITSCTSACSPVPLGGYAAGDFAALGDFADYNGASILQMSAR